MTHLDPTGDADFDQADQLAQDVRTFAGEAAEAIRNLNHLTVAAPALPAPEVYLILERLERLGYGLAQYLAIVYDTDMFRFPIVTPPKIWIEAIVLGFVFAIIAHVIVQRSINKLDWLDASKTKE